MKHAEAEPGTVCRWRLPQLFGRLRLGRRRLMGREDGAVLVEFAMTVPILLSCFFGLIQVCLACYIHQVLTESAREGTRYAIVRGTSCFNGSGSPCTTTATAVNSYVSGLGWPNLGGGTLVVNTTYPDGNEAPGSRVMVTVSYAFPFRVPFVPANIFNMLPTNIFNMSSSSTMYIVQ